MRMRHCKLRKADTLPGSKAGFTLVEVLIVIVIIGLIVGLTIPAITGAIATAKRARMAMDINQLESAIEAYKTANGGEYPPDFSPDSIASGLISTHLRRAFPRNTVNMDQNWWTNAYRPGTYFGVTNPMFKNIDPAEALVFWLSGLVNNPQNPLNPVDANGNLVGQAKSYFEFRTGQLRDRDGDGWPEYYPADAPSAPYLYFESHTYLSPLAFYPLQNASSFGFARPYLDGSSATPVGVNPNKFQIICAGLDGNFGGMVGPNNRKLFPVGTNYTLEDRDNLTNFSEGRTLEAKRLNPNP